MKIKEDIEFIETTMDIKLKLHSKLYISTELLIEKYLKRNNRSDATIVTHLLVYKYNDKYKHED